MSGLDVLEKLKGVDARALTPLQRILLITDGTLTEILEAHFFEPIQLVKLSQNIDDEVLERKILLRGASSGSIYVYAESSIDLTNLRPAFRDELLNSDIPLGRLWREHRLETFKELADVRTEAAGDLHTYFKCDAATPLLARSYNVFMNGKSAMRITEWFLATH